MALRQGYTTGANATAAMKAALQSLILGRKIKTVTIHLPVGMEATFSMEYVRFEGDQVSAGVIKDAGDDPDVTHNALIVSTVSLLDYPGIEIDGGVGVGRVTKPGLPVPVGEAAINPIPRKMLRETALEVLAEAGLSHKGVRIVVSVPRGEEIAKKTLNARLGIIGGISILGTRGTVFPFSTSAYMASVARAIGVAVACGRDHLILSTGGRTEKFAQTLFPDAAEESFIEMGDFVGFTAKQCKGKGVQKITLVGMMGKFSKVAQGMMMVHSKSNQVDFHFLRQVAEEAGASLELCEKVAQANTASEVGDLMVAAGHDGFFRRLCHYVCRNVLQEVGGGMEVETIIISMQNTILGREKVAWNPSK